MAQRKSQKLNTTQPESQILNFPVERVEISKLKPHPQNYKLHPADQIRHLMQSLEDYDQYHNIVIAMDNTILAGHGVVEAARQSGRKSIIAIRLNLDANSPEAIKLLTGDNEIQRLGQVDDRKLTELLRQINETSPTKLLGTGFDDKMLMGLLMVTRPASEIADHDAAAEWLGGGLPDYDAGQPSPQLVISFDSEDERDLFVEQKEIIVTRKGNINWSARWPPGEMIDAASVRFELEEDKDEDL